MDYSLKKCYCLIKKLDKRVCVTKRLCVIPHVFSERN